MPRSPRIAPSYQFPRDFIWGVAGAALQIEGAARADGKGESVWDRFARLPGKVVNGDTPEVACDHYHRYRGDFSLMRKLGIQHNRLSVSWPRIFPTGQGLANRKGLDFYDRVIDALLERGITPWVTLYHWDLPQALEDQGGWRVRSTAENFGRYAETVVRTLGDRVKRWITLNEIPCFIGLAYGTGVHAPGARESAGVLNQCYHHALLAHGYAVQAVRQWGGRGAQVGLTHNPEIGVPITETAPDIAAAQSWFEQRNWHILAPIATGEYPAGYLRQAGAERPQVAPGDLALIAQPTDFLGLNTYSGWMIRRGGRGKPEVVPLPPRFPRADLAWLNHIPQSIYWAIRHCAQLYAPAAMYITENGAGYEEQPAPNGEITDLHRREYLRNHLLSVHRAVVDGLPLQGYFLWSFLDNFEWAEGYVKRFGIVYNDYATQRRTPKLSARWYQQVIRHNRVV